MKGTRVTVAMSVALMLPAAGCGTLGYVAVQSGEASLRAFLDILLTDFTNDLADALLPEAAGA